MKIDRAELRIVPLRLKERFEISTGGRQDRSIVLLRVMGGGHEGWSECVAAEDPGYSYETTETAWHVLSEWLLPGTVGRSFDHPNEVLAPVTWVRGHRMAKAAIEMAAWDLVAKGRGVSLSSALGGTRDAVPVGVSVGLQPSDEALITKVGGYVAEGYARIKIKIKPGRDVEMLRAVRERYPQLTLMADANSAYTLASADRLEALDELDLLMIEQPLHYNDIADHSRLQNRLSTPICLDESIRSERDARMALELGACGVINIKPGRVGGLTESIAIHNLCRSHGVPVWCGGMLESGVGRAHNLALASLPGFSLPGDISASSRYWERDLVDPEFELGPEGMMAVPEDPGIGVQPNLAMIDQLATRVSVFEG